MKALLGLAALMLVILYASVSPGHLSPATNGAKRTPAPTPFIPATPAPVIPSGPLLKFGGRITQHTPDGLLVHCDEFISALPKGYELSDIEGDFLLVGYPDENNSADGKRIRFTARHGELYRFISVLGAQRTVRKAVWADTDFKFETSH